MLFCEIELLCLFRKAILSNTFRHEYKFFYGKSCHHQYSLTVFLQMSHGTRGAEQRANMNPPSPPPPPNPAELMQLMVENQRMLTETINRMANQGGRHAQEGPAPNQYSSFKDFMDTKPPPFREAEEPLQAEEWLNTVEQKFRLLRLTEGLKAEYAAHQLQGPAGIWWNQHREALSDNTVVDWNLFREAFKGHFIPPGVMEMKHTEFMQLTQGNKTIKEYLHAFNHLSRYAPEFVNTEAKKIASFKRGLGLKLLKTMGRSKCATFNEFVSDALT